MAIHSRILAWRIPWTEEPGRLQSMGSQKSRTWLSDWTQRCNGPLESPHLPLFLISWPLLIWEWSAFSKPCSLFYSLICLAVSVLVSAQRMQHAGSFLVVCSDSKCGAQAPEYVYVCVCVCVCVCMWRRRHSVIVVHGLSCSLAYVLLLARSGIERRSLHCKTIS